MLELGMSFRELGSDRVREKSSFLLPAMLPLALSMIADFIIKTILGIIR